ncbi:uncharacterized protein F4807DRAFT_460223 [Annulohypoxylon truncatum]|uniref:uncharacterized protein n=1 Tax=Annulohypoxylon truncatum TaxID=327061 RepID=UPI0020074A01|nr:uncharacterized protein F4807DRAFT_460223 [Annulohypoxylon truncatum]KAI1209930.1 hypothetical protein F4807DRAFT_460223 [Annulohypoxylon truncatum]
MEIEKNCIINPESYDKFELSSRRKSSNEEVLDFLDRDLMNKDAVYERFTEKLLKRWIIKDRGTSGVETLRQAFRKLRDAETGYLSQDRFKNFMNEKWPRFGLAESSEGLTLLFDIFSWHAFFPFPASLTESGTPCIDEDAFLRAICLLTWDPAPLYEPRFSGALHSATSGTWGPHSGWLISKRGKDGSDFLRRIFRSIAVPNSTVVGNETTIQVPRFIYRQPRRKGQKPKDSDSEDDVGQQVVVMEIESERTVDIQDIIAENPPDEIPKTANPLRESYSPALPTLPRHPFDLTDLHVPTTKLVTLLNLMKAVKPGEQGTVQGLITSAEQLGNEGELNWEWFQAVMLNKAEFVANALQEIVGIFKVKRV